jgi:hypothetical protein
VPATRSLRALTVALAVTLAGCMTGERPTLGDTVPLGGSVGELVGDTGVDAVLTLLENTGDATFTARYRITRKLGPNVTEGTVVQDDGRRSITVGDLRFLDGASARTCRLDTSECEDGLQDVRLSDYSIGSSFYAGSPARALRVAYDRRSGSPAPLSLDVAGVRATCVDVPVGPGTERYCATPTGPVALWDTAGLNVELLSIAAEADASAFELPGS